MYFITKLLNGIEISKKFENRENVVLAHMVTDNDNE